MIFIVNCIFKDKPSIVSFDIHNGVFGFIVGYQQDCTGNAKLSKENLIKIIEKEGKNFDINFDIKLNDIKILDIERLFDCEEEELKKYNDQNYFFDCNGMLILPGAIDPHVHFDTPGYDFREDFESASKAAIAGGVTTIIDMPCTSIPPVTSRKNFNEKLSVVSNMAYCDFAFYGGICGKTIEEKSFENDISDLVSCGVKGFKAYLISGMETFPRLTNYQLYKAANICKKVGKPLLLHAEDFEFIDGYLKENDKKSSDEKNKDEIKLYCESRSDLAELIAVQNAAAICEKTGCKIHIVHLSSAKAAKFLKKAKQYCNITFETAPHYLIWTEKDFEKFGSLIKTAPPVKKEEDKIALYESIIDGSCQFVASDHAACKIEEKNTGSFLKDYGGINGVQTIFQYVISEFLDKIPISRLIELTSENAAKFYGLYPKKGAIQKGSDADFVLVKKNERYVFSNDMLYSKMKISPFDGFEFNHKILATFLRGKPAYVASRGLKIKKGEGKYL